jgi:anti-sigma factor RsiW
MNHNPFETWLLSAARLDPRQEEALASHLRDCEDCRELGASMRKLETILQTAPMAAPAPGFSSRWSALRTHEDLQRKRASGWRLLAGAMTATGVTILLIASVFFLTGGSLSLLFADGLQEAVRWILWVRTFGEIGQTIFRSVPLVTVSGAFVSLTALVTATGLTAVAWSISIRRFSVRGVRK